MKKPPYLNAEQIHQLNEAHGWFQHGDAQSDVSKAFAQDAIEMHERLRAAAPELLAALQGMLAMWESVCLAQNWDPDHMTEAQNAADAIDRATQP